MDNAHQITQTVWNTLMKGLIAELHNDGQTNLAQWLQHHTVQSALVEIGQGLTGAIATMASSIRHPTGNQQEREVFNRAHGAYKEQNTWFDKLGDLREFQERLQANITRRGNLVETTSKVMSCYTSMLRLFEVYKGDDGRFDDIHRAAFEILTRSQKR